MKKTKMFSIIFLLLFLSCAYVNQIEVTPCIVNKPDESQVSLNEFCTDVKLSGRTSYICKLKEEYKFDPCLLHRALEVVSKEGLILEGYTFEQFKEWAEFVKMRVLTGLTYDTLKTIILTEFSKINKKVGSQILILGNIFLQLPQYEIIPSDDAILITSSIDDLVKEVRELSIWIK